MLQELVSKEENATIKKTGLLRKCCTSNDSKLIVEKVEKLKDDIKKLLKKQKDADFLLFFCNTK